MSYAIAYSDPYSKNPCIACLINGGLINKLLCNDNKSEPHKERRNIEIALKVSQTTAILIIREMLAQGLLTKEKGGKYSCYRRSNFESIRVS